MKKLVLPVFMLFAYVVSFSQQSQIAQPDTVIAKFGEVLTFNPLINDFDPLGNPIFIDSVYSHDVDILSFNDSLITFRMCDFSLWKNELRYRVFDTISILNYAARVSVFPEVIFDTLKANDIKATIYPSNMQFWNGFFNKNFTIRKESRPQYFYPADSLTSTMFTYGLWMGGINTQNEELHLAGERYNQAGIDFWPGPLTDDGFALSDSINAGKWCRTWKVTKEDIKYHLGNYNKPNYIMMEAISSWPAHGDINIGQAEFLAPFVDVNLNSVYEPENGDYPLIKGDESVFFIYNDHLEHSETEGNRIGVEIHCMAWAFGGEQSEQLNSTVFYSYKIFNRSMITYDGFYVGSFSDFDIGSPDDDYVGCNVENSYYFAYNGRDYDLGFTTVDGWRVYGYHDKIPSQATCFLGGPLMNGDNKDNPNGACDESINGVGFGDGIIDNERLGMGHFLYYSNGGPIHQSAPISDIEYYNHLQGVWKDAHEMVYGGNAHPSTGGDSIYPCRYMWPGDSDPCYYGTGGIEPSWDSLWTEETTGNQPYDRRGLGSVGPFTFEAGAVQYLDIALVTAPGGQEKNSKDLLEDYVASIREEYLKNPEEFGNQYVGIEEAIEKETSLEIYPNPVNGDFVYFDLPLANSVDYKIYNAAGQIILSGLLPKQKQQNLFLGGIESGWYILEVQAGKSIYRSKLIK